MLLLAGGLTLILAARAAETAPAATAPTLQRMTFAWDGAPAGAPLRSAGRVTIRGDGEVDAAELDRLLAPWLGRPLTMELLQQVLTAVRPAFQAAGQLVVDFHLPDQRITAGEVTVEVYPGRYRSLVFRDARYSDEAALRRRLGLREGEPILLGPLQEGMDRLNQSPFRRVQSVISQTDTRGRADLAIVVEDTRPWRLTASFDDQGNRILGYERFTAGGLAGSLLTDDDLMTVQVTVGERPNRFYGGLASYRLPLTGRSALEVSYDFTRVNPTFERGLFEQRGASDNVSLRLQSPLPGVLGGLSAAVGADYKRSDNDLAFGGTRVFASATEIFQLAGALSYSAADRGGNTSVGLTAAWSPGGITAANRRAAFAVGRFRGHSNYAYATLSAQRVFWLPGKFVSITRGTAQVSSENLLTSETLGLGGAGTVRGYDERVLNADLGWFASQELRTPTWTLRQLTGWAPPGLLARTDLQFLVFADFGAGGSRFRATGEARTTDLASVGLGLRLGGSPALSANLDYGWPFADVPGVRPRSGRFHLRFASTF